MDLSNTPFGVITDLIRAHAQRDPGHVALRDGDTALDRKSVV